MSDEILKQKIRQLEETLVLKQNELLQYKTQIKQVNQKLESLIGQMAADQKAMHKIQKILSPTELPRIQGFEFSTKFIPGQSQGGDYFDIFELEDKFSFGVLVASCTGYTVSALLLSVILKISGQMEARKGAEPHKVLETLAQEIIPSLKGKDEAQIFYGIIDRRTFQLRYVQAGHIFSAYMRSGEKIVELEPSCPALSPAYVHQGKNRQLDLQSKDRLVLCTPGLLQTNNLDGESYGKERLKKSLNSTVKQGLHEMRNEILFQLETFSKTSEPHRDLTVIVAEVQDRILKLTKS